MKCAMGAELDILVISLVLAALELKNGRPKLGLNDSVVHPAT